jgi:hypothetical protein
LVSGVVGGVTGGLFSAGGAALSAGTRALVGGAGRQAARQAASNAAKQEARAIVSGTTRRASTSGDTAAPAMADKPYGPLTAAEDLAQRVGEATGVAVKPASGSGFRLRIPSKPRDLLLRMMHPGSGGREVAYWRMSIDGKQALTRTGESSMDPKLTHIDIDEGSFDDIMRLISGLRR